MKVYLDSVGCRLNQSEIERYARQFHAAGHTLVSDPQDADWIVVNTCTVTSKADADSRQKVRSLARRAGAPGIITVTGCWASLQPEAAAALPGVRQVISNARKDDLVPMLLASMNASPASFPADPTGGETAKPDFLHPRNRTRSFIKVQDGCDLHCTFCITAPARGKNRSRPLEDAVREVQAAVDEGAREVVLSGVHLGSWGRDLPAAENGKAQRATPLANLIEAILKRTTVARLRLSSLEPWDLDEDFFRLWEEPRLCRHLHLPLQSGCERTLRRMARRTDQASFLRLVETVRSISPDIALTTDIIAGFPGETDEDFRESLAFVRRLDFAGGHVFTYSERPGTPAARLPDPVPHAVRKARNAQMRALFAEASRRFRGRFLGGEALVLWEHSRPAEDGWLMSGLTDTYLRVQARSGEDRWNRIDRVNLERLSGDGIFGVLAGQDAA